MTGTLIVGAGPAGLAVALALRCHGLEDRPWIIDPSGRWLDAWHRRFAAQDIPHLRSPVVHHPHPDPFAMLDQSHEGLIRSGGTQLPTTARFAAFCTRAIEHADLVGAVHAGSVTDLRLDDDGGAIVGLDDGRWLRPDRVVLATNARKPMLPPALAAIADDALIVHGERARVDSTPVGGRLVVVGGGLSAAHLALGAARRGATVTMITRRSLMVRRFDVHPGWLGPRKRRPFEREPDPVRRRRVIDQARGGGSVPARMRRELDACVEAGMLTLRERCEVVEARSAPDGVTLWLSDGSRLVTDQVWAATGGRIDATTDRLCRPLTALGRTRIVDGLPELEPDLAWPGTRVHLTGFAAALRLGPTAGNLVGHRRAALRITAGMQGLDPERADRILTGAGACPDDAGIRRHAQGGQPVGTRRAHHTGGDR